jgi:hypothetical protein
VALPRATLFSLSVLACSPGPSAPSQPGPSAPATADELRVANGTGQPFAFFAAAYDLAPLLDPVPEVELEAGTLVLVPPGEERPVGELPETGEAPNGGVAVFLYRVTDDGRRARISRVELVSGDDIRAAGGRILIRGL